MVDLDHRQDVCLREAHRNVPDHQRRQRFLAVEYREEVDLVVCRIAQRRLRRDRAHYRLLVVVRVLRSPSLVRLILQVVSVSGSAARLETELAKQLDPVLLARLGRLVRRILRKLLTWVVKLLLISASRVLVPSSLADFGRVLVAEHLRARVEK